MNQKDGADQIKEIQEIREHSEIPGKKVMISVFF